MPDFYSSLRRGGGIATKSKHEICFAYIKPHSALNLKKRGVLLSVDMVYTVCHAEHIPW
jgi:hypothetical protein